MSGKDAITLRDKVEDAIIRAILGIALLIPYPARVRSVGWFVSHVVAPIAGWRRRVRENLALALPDLPKADVERIARNVTDNVGRALIEMYSGKDFLARAEKSSIEGPGADHLLAARESGGPLILLTAHLGNYDAARATLQTRGFVIGGLYKPMTNRLFNEHYISAMADIGDPLFPTTASGIAALIRHLKKGGIVGILGDVASRKAPLLEFFGRPAHTPLSAAEWALKYDAELIPVFGLREADGLTFRLHVELPISRSTPQEMMQQYNDIVERIVRENPDQWFWIHRRWKLSKEAKKALAQRS